MQQHTVVLDSTQMSTFLTCQQYWQYAHVEHLIPTIAEEREALHMGSFGHYILEEYYRSTEQSPWLRLEGAIVKARDKLNSDSDISLLPENILKVEKRLKDYVMYACADNDFYVDSPDQVEVGFSHLIYENESSKYILEGRLDLCAARFGPLTCTVDHKFQTKTKSLYHKSIQFRNYAFVAMKLGLPYEYLVVNYIRLTKEFNENTLKREVIQFSRAELEAWEKQLLWIFTQVRDMKKRIEYFNSPDQNWSACSGKYGAPCQYTPLCEEIDPRLVQIKKEYLFKEGKEWKPW